MCLARLFKRDYYVIADSTDNSVTFSKDLVSAMRLAQLDVAKIFAFKVSDKNYGFTVNPPIDEETQLADVQYNSKYKCVGFECLCPTVNRIFYDYGIKVSGKVRLSVLRKVTSGGEIVYYEICRPADNK